MLSLLSVYNTAIFVTSSRGEERRGEEKRRIRGPSCLCLLPLWDYRQLFNLTSYRNRAHTYTPGSEFHF